VGILDGKVAIVTGAGNGIGRGEALELAAEGARVVVNDLGGSLSGDGADKRPAEEVAELIRARGGEATANYDSVADFAGSKNIVAQAIDEFGQLDVVVNNAGIIRDKMIVSMSEDDFDSVLNVHLKGTWNLTKHAAEHWRAESKAGRQPRAAIVNTVSSAGLLGNVGQSNYGPAKAAIASLTIISSLELGRYGVRANAVAPGGVTRMSAAVVADLEVRNAEDYDGEEFSRLNPANSAPMVAWLASDQALHVTGQVFRAVGDAIGHYLPWHIGAEVSTPKGPRKWKPAEITSAVNTEIFGSRSAGLQMGG
jgi:NAD(P)-dependent dehydrogenase (short-subunit alcohol dehydrogenase family)